jgi:hypothetical protein
MQIWEHLTFCNLDHMCYSCNSCVRLILGLSSSEGSKAEKSSVEYRIKIIGIFLQRAILSEKSKVFKYKIDFV